MNSSKKDTVEKANISDLLQGINEYWKPHVIAELNGQHVKLAKFKGEFVWHSHSKEEEMFMVLEGSFTMEFRDRSITLEKGEMIVVPKGVEHRPVSEEEVSIMLFEPATTAQYGS